MHLKLIEETFTLYLMLLKLFTDIEQLSTFMQNVLLLSGISLHVLCHIL